MSISEFIRRIARRLGYPVMDALEACAGRRPAMTPPRRLRFVGAGDFRAIGEEYLRYFIDLGGLQPTDRVLDVGCGVGRMAVPLTRYLDDRGEYHGIEIVRDAVTWCHKHISERFPHFHFHHADVYNKSYHPRGTIQPFEYTFPFRDETFDFVFLTSVFTHMLPSDMKHYLSETVRVLKKGGRCLITYFLMNEESLLLMGEGTSRLDFRYVRDGYRTIDEATPESAVGFDQQSIEELFSKQGLEIMRPIRLGNWCGRDRFVSYQDILLAVKRSGSIEVSE